MPLDSRRYPIWDLATRLFHWLLVIGFVTSWISAERGNMELHETTGIVMLTLLLFRIMWGLVGSETSRFRSFLRGPSGVMHYLRGRVHVVGHNPLGGWSVMALLLFLLLQAGSGLMNSDDIAFEGPLFAYVSGNVADLAAVIHELAFDALLVLVALHIAAIALYRVTGKNLVKPMITGYGDESPGQPPAPLWRAALLMALSAALVWGPLSLLG